MLATGTSGTTIRIHDAETGSPVSLLGTMGTEMTRTTMYKVVTKKV